MASPTQTESAILAAYRARTPESAKLAAQACELFPSGVTHDGRFIEPHAIYVNRAAGARKWDVDGHEYVDYAGGHGALLLGHNHADVVAAVARQLPQGTHFGACHPLEIRWGECVTQMIPSAEQVRFTSSGTEATLLALRLARAYRGRRKLVRFEGHFHGWHDHMAFGVGSHYDGVPTPGVLEEVADHVLLARPDDTDQLRELLDSSDDVAAVIIEPTGASWGQVPVAPKFLADLRELTARRDIVLIFDEVISGFRCSPGGAQQALGITPDLTTLAKILAGGLPGGAVVGSRDIMSALSSRESDRSGREKVPHHGTFNANPLSAAAGIATLEIVAGTDACDRAIQYAGRLRDGMNQVLAEEGVNWVVYGSFSAFHIFTNANDEPVTVEAIERGEWDVHRLKGGQRPSLINRLRLGMLIHGVDIFAWPGGPTSAAHGDEDLARTLDAWRATLGMLRAEGEIGS